jgi:hypothetical protein
MSQPPATEKAEKTAHCQRVDTDFDTRPKAADGSSDDTKAVLTESLDDLAQIVAACQPGHLEDNSDLVRSRHKEPV